MALGETSASEERRSLGPPEVFPYGWCPALGLWDDDRQSAQHRKTCTPDAIRHRRHADPATPENQGSSESVRCAVGKLFRRAVGLRDAGLDQRAGAADPVVACSGTVVSGLSADDHAIPALGALH